MGRGIRLVERRRLEIIRELAGDVRGLDLCGIGSGGGHVLRMFPGARLTVVDASAAALEAAKKSLAGYDTRFVEGDVDELDLPAASFDRVLCAEALEHARDPEAILRAVARLLRPYAVAVITVPNDPLFLRFEGLARRIGRGGGDLRVRRFTLDAFEGLLGAYFRVTARRASPLAALPMSACFRCVKRA